MVGVVAIEQATLDRERNVAFAKWSEGIVACNVKENIKNSL
jgi:sensor histidine kinase regulating citrate/malate metabolism